MRFMMIVKGDPEGGDDFVPDPDIVARMREYNAEMVRSGVMLAGEGLYPSSQGARLKFSGGRATVIDGPFAESKELIAGFWIIDVKSRDEAIAWASRMPATGDGEEVELRRVYEGE